jgi:Mg-chelatase subunit ChlD
MSLISRLRTSPRLPARVGRVVATSVALGLVLLASVPARGAGRERSGGLDAFVLLDESGSMQPIFARVTGFLADALVRDYLEPGDYLCVIGFADAPHVRLSQRLATPAEKGNVAEIVRSLNVTPAGHTDMGRALEETLAQIERLADPTHQQALLILTDGLNQPPRASPFFAPLGPDRGGAIAPPSAFGPRFLAVVQRLAAAGHRVHVVGLGTETDAVRLAEALGAGHTLLATFDAEALRLGLGRF